MPELRDRKVAISGATGGLGSELARQLSRAGARLFLIARDAERLDRLTNSIRQAGGDATAIVMDLRDPSRIEAACDEMLRTAGYLDVLINNAAVGLYRDAADIEQNDLAELFQVNVFACVHLTRRLLPSMKERRAGMIVNVSSIVGLRAMPRSAGYCMTKAALTSFSDSLRVETRDHGIHVLNVCPGLLASDFAAKAARSNDRPSRGKPMPLDRAASKILRAIRKRKRQIVFPLPAWGLFALQRIAPSLVDRIVHRMYMR